MYKIVRCPICDNETDVKNIEEYIKRIVEKSISKFVRDVNDLKKKETLE